MSFQRPRIYRVYTHIKFANNAKTNHTMVSFTDLIINYNAISIERLPSKIKTGKDSWYFNPIQDGGPKRSPLPVFPL